MYENELARIVFDLGMKIHKTLGPGLLESAYEECLYYETPCYQWSVIKFENFVQNFCAFVLK